ncbi:MAG: class I SAM-dependent methyltransferase, partial [archaeon]
PSDAPDFSKQVGETRRVYDESLKTNVRYGRYASLNGELVWTFRVVELDNTYGGSPGIVAVEPVSGIKVGDYGTPLNPIRFGEGNMEKNGWGLAVDYSSNIERLYPGSAGNPLFKRVADSSYRDNSFNTMKNPVLKNALETMLGKKVSVTEVSAEDWAGGVRPEGYISTSEILKDFLDMQKQIGSGVLPTPILPKGVNERWSELLLKTRSGGSGLTASEAAEIAKISHIIVDVYQNALIEVYKKALANDPSSNSERDDILSKVLTVDNLKKAIPDFDTLENPELAISAKLKEARGDERFMSEGEKSALKELNDLLNEADLRELNLLLIKYEPAYFTETEFKDYMKRVENYFKNLPVSETTSDAVSAGPGAVEQIGSVLKDLTGMNAELAAATTKRLLGQELSSSDQESLKQVDSLYKDKPEISNLLNLKTPLDSDAKVSAFCKALNDLLHPEINSNSKLGTTTSGTNIDVKVWNDVEIEFFKERFMMANDRKEPTSAELDKFIMDNPSLTMKFRTLGEGKFKSDFNDVVSRSLSAGDLARRIAVEIGTSSSNLPPVEKLNKDPLEIVKEISAGSENTGAYLTKIGEVSIGTSLDDVRDGKFSSLPKAADVSESSDVLLRASLKYLPFLRRLNPYVASLYGDKVPGLENVVTGDMMDLPYILQIVNPTGTYKTMNSKPATREVQRRFDLVTRTFASEAVKILDAGGEISVKFYAAGTALDALTTYKWLVDKYAAEGKDVKGKIHITLSDISQENLNIIKARADGLGVPVEIIQESITSPVDKKQYNLVFAMGILEYAPSGTENVFVSSAANLLPAGAIAKSVSDSLLPGGKGYTNSFNLAGKPFTLLLQDAGKAFYFRDPSDVQSLFKSVGLESGKIYGPDGLLYNLVEVKKPGTSGSVIVEPVRMQKAVEVLNQGGFGTAAERIKNNVDNIQTEIQRIHEIGTMDPVTGKFSLADIREKTEALLKLGFTSGEIRVLMDTGIVGLDVGKLGTAESLGGEARVNIKNSDVWKSQTSSDGGMKKYSKGNVDVLVGDSVYNKVRGSYSTKVFNEDFISSELAHDIRMAIEGSAEGMAGLISGDMWSILDLNSKISGSKKTLIINVDNYNGVQELVDKYSSNYNAIIIVHAKGLSRGFIPKGNSVVVFGVDSAYIPIVSWTPKERVTDSYTIASAEQKLRVLVDVVGSSDATILKVGDNGRILIDAVNAQYPDLIPAYTSINDMSGWANEVLQRAKIPVTQELKDFVYKLYMRDRLARVYMGLIGEYFPDYSPSKLIEISRGLAGRDIGLPLEFNNPQALESFGKDVSANDHLIDGVKEIFSLSGGESSYSVTVYTVSDPKSLDFANVGKKNPLEVYSDLAVAEDVAKKSGKVVRKASILMSDLSDILGDPVSSGKFQISDSSKAEDFGGRIVDDLSSVVVIHSGDKISVDSISGKVYTQLDKTNFKIIGNWMDYRGNVRNFKAISWNENGQDYVFFWENTKQIHHRHALAWVLEKFGHNEWAADVAKGVFPKEVLERAQGYEFQTGANSGVVLTEGVSSGITAAQIQKGVTFDAEIVKKRMDAVSSAIKLDRAPNDRVYIKGGDKLTNMARLSEIFSKNLRLTIEFILPLLSR